MATQNSFSLLVEDGPAQAPTKKNKRKKKPAVTHAEETAPSNTRDESAGSRAAQGDASQSLEGFQQVRAEVDQCLATTRHCHPMQVFTVYCLVLQILIISQCSMQVKLTGRSRDHGRERAPPLASDAASHEEATARRLQTPDEASKLWQSWASQVRKGMTHILPYHALMMIAEQPFDIARRCRMTVLHTS